MSAFIFAVVVENCSVQRHVVHRRFDWTCGRNLLRSPLVGWFFLFVYLFIYLFVCVFVCLFVGWFVYLFVCVFVCLCVCLFVCVFVCW